MPITGKEKTFSVLGSARTQLKKTVQRKFVREFVKNWTDLDLA